MTAPKPIDPLLLDYLYGLLDGEQLAAVERRLATPAGRAELQRAERFRDQLAKAARHDFGDFRFRPPSPSARVIKPEPARDTGLFYAAVGLAASVVLAVTGVYFIYETTVRPSEQAVEVARRNLDKQREAVRFAAVRREEQSRSAASLAGEARRTLAQLERELAGRLDRARRDAADRQLDAVVTGPSTLLPGAPNSYRVETRDGTGRPTAAIVSVKIVAADGTTVVDVRDQPSRGAYVLRLPADLPLPPGQSFTLDVSARTESGATAAVRESLALAEPVYDVHLASDRPCYAPGETLRFRALALDFFSHRPPAVPLDYQFRLLAPDGREVAKLDGSSPTRPDLFGVASGDMRLSPELPPGVYTLLVREARDRFPEERLSVLVPKVSRERLSVDWPLPPDPAKPGDSVSAPAVLRSAKGILAGELVRVTASLHGQSLPVVTPGRTGDDGRISVTVTVPLDVASGDVLVRFELPGRDAPPWVRRLPVRKPGTAIDFYPEGGDLIAGVPNRVYFRASGAVNGRVVGGRAEIAVRTDDALAGTGTFEFTPEVGVVYKYEDESTTVALPAVKQTGVVLRAPAGVTGDGEPLPVQLHAVGGARTLLVGAYCRGRLLEHRRVRVADGRPTTLELKPPPGIGGVVRVTVFEETADELKPVAERLVFRRKTDQLHFDAAATETGRVRVTAATQTGEAVAATVTVSLLDARLHEAVAHAGGAAVPARFILGRDVRNADGLERAEILLTDDAGAARAVDLLLGTQGWRRFAEQDPAAFRQRHGADAERVLMARGRSERQYTSLSAAERRIRDELRPAMEQARKMADDAELAAIALAAPAASAEWAALHTATDLAERDYAAAVAQLDEARAARMQRFSQALGVVAVVSGVVALLALGLAAANRRPIGWLLAAVAVGVGTAAMVGPMWLVPATPVVSVPRVPPVPVVVPVPSPAEPREAVTPAAPRPKSPGLDVALARAQQWAAGWQAPAVASPGSREAATVATDGRGEESRPAAIPLAVREFAFRADRPMEGPFSAATLYWNPALTVGDRGAHVPLDVPPGVTAVRVIASGFTADGRLGHAVRVIPVPAARE